MEIGRRNITKSSDTQPITENSPQPQEQKPTTQIAQAKDTFEVSPQPNDLAKALADQRKAELPGMVQADQAAVPQFGDIGNRQTGQEHYGTSTGSIINPDHPDRFGFKDPSEQDPIADLNQRGGLGFDPHRDLRISTEDALSYSSKDPLGKSPSSSSSENQDLKKENQKLKDENSSLQGLLAFQQMQAALQELDRRNREIERLNKEAMEKVQGDINKAKNPNPDAPDNSSGGPFNPLINNLGSPMRIRQPFVDPQLQEQFGPSGVLKQRNQAVDPNPDADPNEGGAQRTILSTSDAVTDPTPDLSASLEKLNNLKSK